MNYCIQARKANKDIKKKDCLSKVRGFGGKFAVA